METDLATQLIEANKEREANLDELGIPLPQVDTTRAHYNYLVARAFISNPHLHTRRDRSELWNGHKIIMPEIEDISRLTKWVDKIPRQGVVYIYDKIKEMAPQLNDDIIAITPHLAWDFKNQQLIESKEEFNVISDW